MKALILAAGYATRLYPLTKDFPKSLLDVGKSPIINHIIKKLEKIEEVDEIIVVTNSRFIAHFVDWRAKLAYTKTISLVDDLTSDNETRRGAVGDMDFVIKEKNIQDDFLVVGGDNLFDGSIGDFLAFAKTKKGSPVIGVYDLKDIASATKYGVIELDNEKQVIDFEEKPRHPKSTLVGMCLYYFPKEKLGLIKEYLSGKDRTNDATGSYIDWLRKKVAVFGFIFSGRWFDIGDHKYYNEAKEKFSASS